MPIGRNANTCVNHNQQSMDYKFKCEFIDIYNEKCKVFQNRQEFYNDKEKFTSPNE